MDAPLGPVLIALARHAIATRLGLDAPPPREHPALATPGASFVTLTAGGALRGCIGQLQPWNRIRTERNQCEAGRANRYPYEWCAPRARVHGQYVPKVWGARTK